MDVKLELVLVTLMLYLLFLQLSIADSVLYVRPSPLVHCPAEPCHTLSEYAHNISHYFTSNTTLIFLSGTHELDTNLTVSGFTSLQLLGNTSEPTSCKVVCTQPAHVNVSNVAHVVINALSFSSCGGAGIESALYISNALNCTLDSCQLCNSHNARGLEIINANSVYIRSCKFENNTNSSFTNFGGGGAFIMNSYIEFSGHNEFVNNYVFTELFAGGGLQLLNSSAVFTGPVVFRNGTAQEGGGLAIRISKVHFHSSVLFAFNSAIQGGALYLDLSTLNITNVTTIEHNSAHSQSEGSGGGICMVSQSTLYNFGFLSVNSNTADDGGGMKLEQKNIIANFGEMNLWNNNATIGGGIWLGYGNSFVCKGQLRVIGNTATSAGGIYNSFDTFIILQHSTELYFINNTAKYKGGAIYVDDSVSSALYCTTYDYFYKFMCFYQLEAEDAKRVHMTFDGNVAALGDDLYGGMLGICKLGNTYQNSSEVFDEITNMRQNETISSDAFQIRTCNGNEYANKYVFPGEMFTIEVVAVGQRNGLSQGIAQVNIIDSSNTVSLGSYNQSRQLVGPNCTSLNLTVISQENISIHLQVIADICVGQSSTFNPDHALHITLRIKPCPQPLFQLSDNVCRCSKRLNGFNSVCNVTNQSILKTIKDTFWLGYDNNTKELIIHPNCPFYYCVFKNVSFSIDETDLQCSHDRSGLLCGACRDGHSLTLGLHMCSECSNFYLLLLPVFMILGIALVIFLMTFKLSVAQGTISGLIFYANIFQMNKTVFLPNNTSGAASFLFVFVSWLNLNFGFVTCLSNGMDMYVLTWLQYLFPLYILFLVVVLVSFRHYPRWMSRMMGTNPVAVLSTLILLSYNKILHTIVASVSSTELQYKNHNKTVWLYDGTVPFLGGKHSLMFGFAVMVFLFMVLPYTLLLLCGQCILLKSNWRIFCWINNSKVKAFLDSYHGPYRVKHRYWPGLLLLLRVILLPPVAFAHSYDASVNLLAVSTVVIAILTWAWMAGGIYQNRWLDVLEASIMLNLGILTAATYYYKMQVNNESPVYVSLTSLGVVFLTFIGIMAYHVHLTLKNTHYGRKVMLKVKVSFGFCEADENEQVCDPLLRNINIQ